MVQSNIYIVGDVFLTCKEEKQMNIFLGSHHQSLPSPLPPLSDVRRSQVGTLIN